jgi:hypothetical protein
MGPYSSGVSDGRIAQLVERGANNAAVLGSSPSMTILFLSSPPNKAGHPFPKSGKTFPEEL